MTERYASLFFNTHIFCCTNQREAGHPRSCCADKDSEALRDYMKERCKVLGIRKLRVNNAGCLDRCELGPVMVIYPEAVWYTYRTEADIDEIIERHVQKGEVVERLLLPGSGQKKV